MPLNNLKQRHLKDTSFSSRMGLLLLVKPSTFARWIFCQGWLSCWRCRYRSSKWKHAKEGQGEKTGHKQVNQMINNILIKWIYFYKYVLLIMLLHPMACKNTALVCHLWKACCPTSWRQDCPNNHVKQNTLNCGQNHRQWCNDQTLSRKQHLENSWT